MNLHLSRFSWIRYSHNAAENTKNFMQRPWAGGVVLLLCVIIAMALANMEWSAAAYHDLLTTDLSVLIHTHDGGINLYFPRDMNVERFVNDALMVIFFFGVGLEIKREVIHGELSSVKSAMLPVLAALGGMIMPALIYMFFNHDTPVSLGWGVPMATDIAFALGILSMLGSRVPTSLKMFLMALAVADDLGAIVVIALFYGGDVNIGCLLLAVAIMVGVYFMNRIGERRMFFYIAPAILVWSLFYYSGLHATMSGVVMAMLIPTTPRYRRESYARQAKNINEKIAIALKGDIEHAHDIYYDQLHKLSTLSRKAIPMDTRLEECLAPYIAFLVMPIFALVNGGVKIDVEHLDIFKYSTELGSIGLGVFIGLVVGKPLGITLFSWIAIRLKLASMPSGANWAKLISVACLGGIGFTMSIFVDTLAFMSVDVTYVDQGKIAILAGSLVAAIVGIVMIMITSNREKNRII